MKAMVLAAGLGTRLRPLTNDRPKALVEIGGRTLLEITLHRLRRFGVDDVIVNVHHFADMVVDCLRRNNNFGMKVTVSREDELLDTGGGLKRAAYFFMDGASQEPFFLHNVDVLSSVDLSKMMDFHKKSGALATLAMQARKSSRMLLFDEEHRLCGRRTRDAEPEMVQTSTKLHELAFSGIHVISPEIFSMLDKESAFPIIPTYLRLAGGGEKVISFRADEYYWRDLGTQMSLQRAFEDLQNGVVIQ